METNTAVTFTAAKAGKLTVVTHSPRTNPTIKIGNDTYSVSADGATEINLTAGGIYTIGRGTTNTYLYYISFTES